MNKLTRVDLYSLERYAKMRDEFRARLLAHKKPRKVHLGAHATLYFEDRLTIQYQIQEMLRVERIFEEQGIDDELNAYNPLIPDGSNWKATFMVEYEDIEERQRALGRLIGIEDQVWVRVDGFNKVYAIADEDLGRETGEKTSAVHFLRFELEPAMAQAVKHGADIGIGVDHQNYTVAVEPVARETRATLAADLS